MLSLIIHKLVKVFALFHHFPPFFHLFESKESIAWCFLVDRNIFLRNTGITGFEKFPIYTQPRPQGFSLKKLVGKVLGTRLHLHCVTDVRRRILRPASDVCETAPKLPCSRPTADSANYGNCVSNFPST